MRNDIIRRNDETCPFTVGATMAEATVGEATASGATAADAVMAGAAETGVVARAMETGAVFCGPVVLTEAVPATLAAGLSVVSPLATEGRFVVSVKGWGSQAFGSFNFCSKAARQAAWAALSAARTETKPVPRTTHKPKVILFFRI